MIESLLTAEVVAVLAHYKRLFVALSGGLDSTVLLHSLAQVDELHPKLVAVHINHGLSPHATAWQAHCERLSLACDLPFIVKEAHFQSHHNIEDNARQARYALFADLVEPEDALLVAHHADDQAETFLLQLFRGAGVAGLSAMPFIKPFAKGQLIRPFLSISRAALEIYARTHQLQYVTDESNFNTHFSRNYIRHEVLPILTKRWPAVCANIGRSTRHCQEAQQLLTELALDKAKGKLASPCMDLALFEELSLLETRNMLREWLRAQHVKMPSSLIFERFVSELILARNDARPLVEWGKWAMRRFNQRLYLTERYPIVSHIARIWIEFPKPLYIEGLGTLTATQADDGIHVPTGAKVKIRFREGGEKMRLHGQTKALKKLFQSWNILPWQRHSVPLIEVDNQIISVVGFANAEQELNMTDKTLLYKIELQRESE